MSFLQLMSIHFRIAWTFNEERLIDVDDYEQERKGARRSPRALVLTRQDREELLLEWGVTFHDIIDSIRSNVKVKHQRRRTVNAIGTYDRWEEVFENASRRIKRTLLMKPKEISTADSVSVKPAIQKTERKLLNTSSTCLEQLVSTYIESERAHIPRSAERGPTNGSIKRNVSIDTNSRPPTRTWSPENRHKVALTRNSSAEELSTKKVLVVLPPDLMGEAQAESVPTSHTNASEGDHNSMASGSFADEFSDDDSIEEPRRDINDFSDVGDSISEDSFEHLRRDDSFWEVQQGLDSGPEIRRKMTPIVITEDEENHFQPTYGNDGVVMQPTPHSERIISRWE
jgi:hypothetical protein